jgi:hypothetical protein
MINRQTYSLNESEVLIFKGENTVTHLYSRHEGCAEMHIGTYTAGRWVFADRHQERMFFILFNRYRYEFFRAFKSYLRTFKEKPATYHFTCLRRKFTLQVVKLGRKMQRTLGI